MCNPSFKWFSVPLKNLCIPSADKPVHSCLDVHMQHVGCQVDLKLINSLQDHQVNIHNLC